MTCFYTQCLRETCNVLQTFALSDTVFTFILLDVWSRWWWSRDRCGQCSLHGRFLLSSESCIYFTFIFYGAIHVLNFCNMLIFVLSTLCVCVRVCFRLRTSGTVLIKLMRTWRKSKRFSRSSCLLPHQIRVRYLTSTIQLFLSSFSRCVNVCTMFVLSYVNVFKY